MTNSGVYAIVCSGSWRSYVGSSCDFEQRKETHLSNLRNKKHQNNELQEDFNQFGESNFYFEIIEEIINLKNLLKREEYWKSIGCNLYNSKNQIYCILPKPSENDIKNFWSKVEKTDKCWFIKNCKNKRPKFQYQKIRTLASRISYKFYYDDFDESLVVCHDCDNPLCVNPEHLFLGTQKDNMQDRINKGRGRIKLNKILVGKIREKYIQDKLNNTSTVMRKWLFENFNISIAKNTMNKILNNFAFTDEKYNINYDRNKCKIRKIKVK